MIGRAGMGWSSFFIRLARRGEPIKVEGDKRAPAGIYPIGRSFGILASSRPNYLQVTPDTICVHDPVIAGLQHHRLARSARARRSARRI